MKDTTQPFMISMDANLLDNFWGIWKFMTFFAFNTLSMLLFLSEFTF